MKKKFISILLSLALCLSMLSGVAFASSDETTLYLGPLYEFELDTKYGMSNGNVDLKNTNEVAWIDRLDFGEETWQRTFYNSLTEAADGDGENDYLIDNSYYAVNGDAYISQRYSSGQTMAFNAVVAHTLTTNRPLSYAESQYYYNCILAVCSAFNRDHPEMFWMSGITNIQTVIASSMQGYTYTFYYILKTHEGFSGSHDARDDGYQDESAIRDGIAALNAAVAAIGTNAASDTYELLSHFNSWLTKNNQYNTSGGNYPAASHRSITALTGNAGVNGPVCEGYARAFKVLCDRYDIPCVLVDGYAGESHMWNYVQMEDGKWYAVDVTWNDPTSYFDVDGVALSGNECTTYFLIGSNTVIDNARFGSSRTVFNQVTYNGVAFTNGPVLNPDAYVYTPQTVLAVTTESQSVNKDQPIDQSKYTATGLLAGHTLVLAPNGGEIIVQDVLDDNGISVMSQYSISYISKGTYHEFDTEYCSDGTDHWRKCLVSGCTEITDKQACAGGTATCTQLAVCGICQQTYGSLAEHSYTVYTPNDDATCQNNATETSYCDFDCGTTDIRAIDGSKCDHKYTVYASNNDATCQADGTETASCDFGCGTTDTRIAVNSKQIHKYSAYTSNGDATCQADGTETAACDFGCGATDTRTASNSKVAHKYSSYTSNNNATCQADGTETASCDFGCGTTDTRTAANSKQAHKYSVYTLNNDATCQADGTETATCDFGCGTKDTRIVANSKVDHKYTTYVSNNDATCQADGTETAACDFGCGATDARTAANSRVDHKYTTYVSNNDATCQADGTETASCDFGCGTKDIRTAANSKVDHKYTTYVSNNDATCQADGTETASCDFGCGTKDTRTVVNSKLAHTYTDDADATCNECGYEREITPAGPVLDTELAPAEHEVVITLTPTEEYTSIRYAIWADGDQAYTLHWANATFNNGAWVANVPQCALPVPGNYIIHIYDFVGETPEFLMESTFTVAEGDVITHTYSTATDHTCDVCGTLRTVPMFRMYDPNSSEHFYTGSEEERDSLVAAGWDYEGVAFNFPAAGAPVYRMYEEATGEHLYTMDEAERAEKLALGWKDEGVAFNSASTAEVPQYRLRNPNATRGRWHFTGSEEERDFLIGLGWIYEGIGWYSALR